MFNAKTLLSIAMLGFVAATPAMKRQADNAVCQLVVTQTGSYTGTELQSAINYGIGRTIAQNWSGKMVSGDYPLTVLPDGKLGLAVSVAVEDVDSVDVAALIEAWVGQTLEGFNNTEIIVHEADCE